MRSPRDPSLDPQLVWRGKDEQNSADLEVPSLFDFLHDFDDFDGLDFGDKVDVFAHEAKWCNCMLLGDSPLAMTSLAEREGLRGKARMIDLDPPYGFRFGSNWQVMSVGPFGQDRCIKDTT